MRKLPSACAIALLLFATACARPTPVTVEATATEDARCEAWRDALPSRSRSDTQQTQDEIALLYDVFLAACEGYDLPFGNPG